MAPPLAAASSMSYETDVLGRTEPRIWTPPLRELTPDTSYGYDVIDFAEEIGWPLDPWEQWAVIHGGELNEDGTPRFRFLLILVARQNGKTTLLRVLILYWMFVECHAEVLGTHADRGKAKESWREVINMAEGIEMLKEELPTPHVRLQLSEEAFWNVHGSTYKFAATNRRAGRGSTLKRVVLDELREHTNRDTYNAVVPAGNAVRDFQVFAITNQGDANSVVLDEVRASALGYIETGRGDGTLFLAEWSAPSGCDPTDLEALAMANPNLGRRIVPAALMGQAIQAKQAGGAKLADFRTEYLCQRVTLLDPAIDPDGWDAGGTDEPVDLALPENRRRVALCFDVAPEGTHATLVAAAKLPDGTVHVEVVKAWHGFGTTKALRAELPGLVAKVRPRAVGWFPSGPAAAVAADMVGRRGWPPPGVAAEELKAETPAVCMGLADLVLAGEVEHGKQDALTEHVRRTQRLRRGAEGLWTFTRAGKDPVDGTYALAGAVHLARTIRVLAPVAGA